MKAILFPAALLLLTFAAGAAEVRTWTSKDGTATLRASYRKMEGDLIVLLLPNGRAQKIQKAFLSDADLAWIERNSGQTADSGRPAGAPGGKIPTALAGRLIDERGRSQELTGAPRYYLFYYSASWCGPCLAFTPELVQFYRKMKARKASLEVILLPSDHSAEDQLAYMKEARMPWPGLAFEHRQDAAFPRNTYGYIPSMVLVDAAGNRVLEVSKELRPDSFLKKLEDLLREDAGQSQTAGN